MSLRRSIEQATGLVPGAALVERAVRERMALLGLRERADYAPAQGSAEFDALLDLLVVPESWMMRDPAVFEEALRFVQRHPAQRPLRILSLPCAGGEEPYSMAMVLIDAGIGPERCRIDAFDLSAAAIERARAGRYGRNAFRNADLAFRARHFRPDGEHWIIGAAPRAYVHFARANLFALDVQPASYDLVFCRNLLIYFDAATAARGGAVLKNLLCADGLLLSGYAEAPSFCRNGFAPVSLRSPFALVRQDAHAAPARPALRPRAAEPLAAAAAPRPRATADELLAQAQRLADGGRLAEAEASCAALLERLPAHAGAWFLLGMIHESAGQGRAAERCWRRCVYLDPGHYEALCGLALLHERMGDSAGGAGFRRRAARVFEGRGSGKQ
jgi:chemotaxis protein methyltransferase WspC